MRAHRDEQEHEGGSPGPEGEYEQQEESGSPGGRPRDGAELQRLTGKALERDRARRAQKLQSAEAQLATETTASAGLPYAVGDLFVGDGGPTIHHFANDGTLLEDLRPTVSGSGSAVTGMCFDAQGNLYATVFGASAVAKFDSAGRQVALWTTGMFTSAPESCMVDKDGHVYVGFVDPNFGVKIGGLQEFDSDGHLLATFTPPMDDRGIDWIEMGSDGCTLYCSSEGTTINRFNLCTGQQMSRFAVLPAIFGSCYAHAIRPNGEMLVACSYDVYRLSPTGTVLQTYSDSSLGVDTTRREIFALALDTDNTSFWVSQNPRSNSFNSPGDTLRVDIASGEIIDRVSWIYGSSGLAMFGSNGPKDVPAGGPLTPPETLGGGNPSEPCAPCQVAQNGDYPVNTASGDFWHTYADIRIPGRGRRPLGLTRTYNSLSANMDGPFGYGWTSSYAMSLSVDPQSGAVTIHQENGSTTTFSPDPSGGYTAPPHVLAMLVRNGDGTYSFTRRRREAFMFSADGRLIAERDLNGNTTTLSYDGSGKLTTVSDPAGRELTLTYGANGKVSSVEDPGGRVVAYGYDGAGNLESVTDTGDGVTHFTYQAGHLLKTMTDPNGGTVTNGYDGSGRLTSQTDALTRTTTYEYGADKTTITSPKGSVTEHQFDANRQLSRETRGLGTSSEATWSYGYDPQTLQLATLTDPNGHARSYARDGDGNVTRATDGLGRSAIASYNEFDGPTAVTDPSGVTTTYTYDGAGNLTASSRPLSGTSETQTTIYEHADPSHPGDVTGIIDPNGKTTRLEYDAAGNLTRTSDPLGNATTRAYNVLGQVTSMVSARGNAAGADPSQFQTTFEYNGLGALTKLTDPLGKYKSFGYDANGNRTSITDANGNPTTYTFDLADQLNKITRADDTTFSYSYDDDGNPETETNGATHTTSYSYDPLERVVSITDPRNRTSTIGYDGAGNRTAFTSAANQTTTFSYDAADQLTGAVYSHGGTPDIAYTYTKNGLRASMSDGSGTTNYTYDSLNRVTSVQNGAGRSVGYGYDLKDNLTSITYPNGNQVTRTYNDASRLTSVSDWLSHTTRFSYDPDGNLTGQDYANGTTATSTFDRVDRLTAIA